MSNEELQTELRKAIVDFRRCADDCRRALVELDAARAEVARARKVINTTLQRVIRTDRAWCEWLQIEFGIDNAADWWKGDGEAPEFAG